MLHVHRPLWEPSCRPCRTALSDEALIEWQLDRLDYKKQMPKARGPANHLSLSRCVDYDSQEGLEVAVVAARAISGQ